LVTVVVEHVAWIIEPTLFGNLIDATIDKLKGTPDSSLSAPLSSGGAFPREFGGALRGARSTKRIYPEYVH